MNPLIARALTQGFTINEIIKWLLSNNSPLSRSIKEATKQGYTQDQIGEYLTKGSKFTSGQRERALEGMTEKERAERMQYRGNAGKDLSKIMNIAYPAAAAYAGYTAGQKSVPPMPNAEPPPMQDAPSAIQPAAQGMQQQAVQRATGMGVPTTTQQVATQAALSPQAAPAIPTAPSSMELVTKENLLPHIAEYAKNYDDPSHIAAALYSQFPKHLDRIQKAAGKPMEEVIGDVLGEIKAQQPEVETNVMPPEQVEAPQKIAETLVPQQVEPEQTIEPEIKPMDVGSSVLTPSGEMGEIEKISGKTAQIKTESGKKGSKFDELLPVPENSDEIADIYQNLIDKIPEGYKSRMADYVGYSQDDNSLLITFHDGSSYDYQDVPEDIVKEIVNSDFMAKTTGGNYLGKWYKDAPSIGAGISLLISDLQKQRGGKGKEYDKKYKEMYSMHRLAKEKLKEKKENEKREERAKKRKK